MTKIMALVFNCGEFSVNYSLFAADDNGEVSEVGSGSVDKIGTDECAAKTDFGVSKKNSATINDHAQAMEHIANSLTLSGGPVESLSDIKVVGHRVIHGGKDVSQAMVVDAKLEALIEKLNPLAPQHNPSNLLGIQKAKEVFPVKHVAVFDTAFHATMPPESYRYALPTEIYEQYEVRRYGFHGISYHYVSGVASAMLGKKLEDSNMIICHLANSSSMACLKKGKVIDTTTGMTATALDGLMMGTRCGDVDPGVYTYLCQHVGLSPQDVDSMLNEHSGLLGICGKSDMREVVGEVGHGNENAKLARQMFVERVRKYLGAFLVKLRGEVDAIVFTAQFGENDKELRELVTEGLSKMGAQLDEAANQNLSGAGEIQTESSQCKILVVPSQEELCIAQQVLDKAGLVKVAAPKAPATGRRPRLASARTRRFSLTPDMVASLQSIASPTKTTTYIAIAVFVLLWAILASFGAKQGNEFVSKLMSK